MAAGLVAGVPVSVCHACRKYFPIVVAAAGSERFDFEDVYFGCRTIALGTDSGRVPVVRVVGQNLD